MYIIYLSYHSGNNNNITTLLFMSIFIWKFRPTSYLSLRPQIP